MVRFLLGNTRTGARLQDLQVVSGEWSQSIGAPEDLSAIVDLSAPEIRRLNLYETARPVRSYLAALDGDRLLGAGPIWAHSYDRDAGTLKITAQGLGSLFKHRLILPPSALTQSVTTWEIADPANPGSFIPNPNLATTITGVSLGTIVKRLTAQALSWPGATLPIIYGPDEADSNVDHQRTYNGTDFKAVLEAIQDIGNLDDGIEARFVPQFTADRRGLQWFLQAGTLEQPLLYGYGPDRPVAWNVTTPASPVSGLTVGIDGTGLASLIWAQGGQPTGSPTLVARAYSSALTDANFPLMELVDGSHTSVVRQPTLDAYARGGLLNAATPTETWEFNVRAHPADDAGNPLGPQLGDFGLGDFAELRIQPFDETTGRGDPYRLTGGTVPLRITAISGDDKGDVVKISAAPQVGSW